MESAPACKINIGCTVGAESISARYPKNYFVRYKDIDK